MINFDDYANENKTEHNFNCLCIPDHPYRVLIIGGLGSGKTNALLNLISNQLDLDKISLYAKDPYEVKYLYLINKRESIGLKHFNDPKAFTEYSNDMQDVYKNIGDYNVDRENKSWYPISVSLNIRVNGNKVITNNNGENESPLL